MQNTEPVIIASDTVLFVDLDGTTAMWNPNGAWQSEGYYKNLDPMQNVIDALKKVAEEKGYELYILSAYPSKGAKQDKMEWVDKHIPFIDEKHRLFVPFGENKAEFIEALGLTASGKLLISDYSPELHDWVEQKGWGLKVMNGFNGNHGTWTRDAVDSSLPSQFIYDKIIETTEKMQEAERSKSMAVSKEVSISEVDLTLPKTDKTKTLAEGIGDFQKILQENGIEFNLNCSFSLKDFLEKLRENPQSLISEYGTKQLSKIRCELSYDNSGYELYKTEFVKLQELDENEFSDDISEHIVERICDRLQDHNKNIFLADCCFSESEVTERTKGLSSRFNYYHFINACNCDMIVGDVIENLPDILTYEALRYSSVEFISEDIVKELKEKFTAIANEQFNATESIEDVVTDLIKAHNGNLSEGAAIPISDAMGALFFGDYYFYGEFDYETPIGTNLENYEEQNSENLPYYKQCADFVLEHPEAIEEGCFRYGINKNELDNVCFDVVLDKVLDTVDERSLKMDYVLSKLEDAGFTALTETDLDNIKAQIQNIETISGLSELSERLIELLPEKVIEDLSEVCEATALADSTVNATITDDVCIVHDIDNETLEFQNLSDEPREVKNIELNNKMVDITLDAGENYGVAGVTKVDTSDIEVNGVSLDDAPKLTKSNPTLDLAE